MNHPTSEEEDICKQLEKRNKLYDKFAHLIVSHIELSQNQRELQKLNQHLQVNVDKLQRENHELTAKLSVSSPVYEKNEQAMNLEKKLYRVQEELTEVHRTKGARAQQIIDLNVALQEKEKELQEANNKLTSASADVKSLTKNVSDFEQEIIDLKQANATLNDEYQALLIMSDVVDKKLRDCQLENQTLLDRWLIYKDKEAKALNTHNDQIHTVLVDKSKVAEPPSKSIPPSESTTNLDRPVSSSTAPSTSPTSMTTSSSFKDKFQNFFGINKQKSEEHVIPSYHAMQYSAIVRLPEEAACSWKAHDSEVTAVRFPFSGSILTTGGSDRLIHVWNFIGDKPRLQSTLRGCNGAVTSIDYDPQEVLIAASSSDYACRVWTLNSQRLKITLTGHRGSVQSNKFLNTPNRLASGSKDRTVKVWDVTAGACTRTFMAGSSCTDIAAADSIECLASGHFDRKIRMWDARVSAQAQSEVSVGGRVTSLDMPLDKTMLLCCTKDHTLELIDLRKNSVMTVFQADVFRVANDQTRCAFSPDGKFVAAGSSDGSVISWDVKTGAVSTVAKEHNDPVISCNWSGGRFISGDKNKTCVIWTDS